VSTQHIVFSQKLTNSSGIEQFRERATTFLRRHKWTVVLELTALAIIFAGPLFTFSSGVLGLAFVVSMLWLRSSSVRDLGLRKPPVWSKAIFRAVVALVIILSLQGLLVQPLLRYLFPQPPNFSRFHGMTPAQLLGWISIGLTLAAVSQEIIRAYLIYSIVSLVGDSRIGWLCAVIGSSLFYALNHDYQGLAGALGAVISCAGFGVLYLASKRNLWSPIICHGLNDTIAFCAIYFGAIS
jgi:CAAX protease family protein